MPRNGFKTFNEIHGQGGAADSNTGINEYVESIEFPTPTLIVENRLGMRGGFETTFIGFFIKRDLV